MSGFSVTASIIGRLTQRRNRLKQTEEAKKAYAAVLDEKQAELEDLRLEQQRIRTEVDPELEILMTRARDRDPKLWERRPGDTDFLNVRLGIGELPSTVAISVPQPDMPDPRLEGALALEAEYAVVPQVPVTGTVRQGPLGIAGSLRARTDVARALICNLAVHHSPDEVHLLVAYSPERAAEWQWLTWLPHTYALSRPSRRRYLAGDPLSTENLLRDLLDELHRRQNQLHTARHVDRSPAWPWLVLLVENDSQVRDDPAVHLLLSSEARELNVTAIFLVDQAPQVPMGCSAVVAIQPNGQLKYATAGVAGEPTFCWPEYADAAFCEQLARSLAPIQVHTLRSDTALPSSVRLLDLMGIEDIATCNVARNWQRRSPDQYLKVTIGEQRGNQPLVLDLDHTGHGPHGLVAGTTGSGKSELLQTLVVALALTHHPHDVGFVLVDFKGGGAFSDLVDLPHTQGLVSDLSGNLTERALMALRAEMDRRKRLFNAVGVNDIGLYQQLRWQGRVEEPLPRLVVIIDEFAELVSEYPDFLDGLIGIARVGRSLGLHLILATQSPAGVVKQQIWANAKFRICLRVESRQESMEMLHRPEAANLPRMPGRGYLQVGNDDVFELFQVARVAGPYRSADDKEGDTQENHITIAEVSPLGERKVLLDSKRVQGRRDAGGEPSTDLKMVVQKLADVAKQMRIKKLPSPWPDPLPDHVALPDLLRQGRYAGWDGETWAWDHFDPSPGKELEGQVRPPNPPRRPWLGALLGLLDDPANQRQGPLLIELGRQDGQLIVLGAPGSGKEMWARTLVMSLACTHAPDQLQLYLLDFGGQALHVFKSLPHVGGLLAPTDDERVRRLLRRLLDSLEKRKRLCNRAGVDGLTRLRELKPEQAPPAILVIVAGFLEFRTLFHEQMLPLTRLIREGGPYGIHLTLMGDRAGDVPMAISSVVTRRIVLRLAEADEYGMVLGTRIRLSQGQKFPPGRGWYGRPPLEFQTASPGYEQDESAQIAELQRIVDRMDKAWDGPRPEPVETLPIKVSLESVLSRISAGLVPPMVAVPIGLDGTRLRPAFVDLVDDGPHFIVSSTPQGGKTTLLLTWALALAEFNSPQQVQFVLTSGRRGSLEPLKKLPHVLDCCRGSEEFHESGVLPQLLAEIRRREGTLAQGSAGVDEWAHIVVMFDDYDEFFNAVGREREIADGLLALAKRGRNVDVHIVVTGPLPDIGGIAFRDPLIKQLRIGRSGFILRILDAGDQNPLGLRMKASEIRQTVPGRGYAVRNGFGAMIQVATPGDSASVADWVARLRRRWTNTGANPASWAEE
jgi:S-DNA-T family DNA segregation ATPase FtsK/SpoIIIE